MRISVADVYELGAEFFRWEIATAVAGSVLGIHPFDQPDVEASKIATKELTSAYEKSGSLPAETPFFESGGLRFFADTRNAAALSKELAKDAQLGRRAARALRALPRTATTSPCWPTST